MTSPELETEQLDLSVLSDSRSVEGMTRTHSWQVLSTQWRPLLKLPCPAWRGLERRSDEAGWE